ncbi:MAG: hypothetical protein ABI925_09825 [Verrucomicrobiota bacterium]
MLLLLCSLCGCWANQHTIRTTDGHSVIIPTCKAAISYQGSKWGVQGPKYQGAEAGSVQWERLFREVEPLIEVIDQQELRRCESLNTMVSISTLAEVKKELAARDSANQKREQLELIISMGNSAALQEYIKTYFLRVDPSFVDEHLDQNDPATVVGKTSTGKAYKLRNIDARPVSSIIAAAR